MDYTIYNFMFHEGRFFLIKVIVRTHKFGPERDCHRVVDKKMQNSLISIVAKRTGSGINLSHFVHVFFASRANVCNSLTYGLPGCQRRKLQQ